MAERKLSAIMFTDMVGYSALIQDDEALGLKLLEEHRKILRALFPKYSGQEVETAGDAFFVEFSSALEAVNCAIDIQKVLWERNENVPLEKQIKIRIGIHLGDVIHQGKYVLGDGVNIAARIEPLAQPSGICITEDIARQVQNKIDFPIRKIDSKNLKNIKLPVDVYDIVLPYLAKTIESAGKIKSRKIGLYIAAIISLLLIILFSQNIFNWIFGGESYTEKNSNWQNSIAVLPFATIDRTEESEIFSEGMHEDILSQVAKISEIKVIARTSVLQYKDSQKRLKEIAEELNVKTILEGSVRRSGKQIRIVAQLIDAASEDLIWSETYNRTYADIFSIQSDVAIKIADELKATLTLDEKKAIEEVPTNNLEAYEYYQRGLSYRGKGFILEKYESEIDLLNKAIKLDQNFVLAYSELCKTHLMIYWYNEQLPKEHLLNAEEALLNARNIDPNNSSVYLAEGYYYYYGFRDYEQALDKFQLSLLKYPNDSELLAAIGYVKRRLGKHEEAIEYQKKAVEIDPYSSNKAHEIGKTARLLRNWDLAEKYLIKATAISPQNTWAYLDRVELSIDKNADLSETGKILNNALLYNDQNDLIWIRAFIKYLRRDYEKGLKILNEYKNTNITDDSKILLFKGRIALAANKQELASSYFDSLRTLGLSGLAKQSENWTYHNYLYKSYAGLGMVEEFKKEYELLENLIPFNKDFLVGADREVQKIECLIWLNEFDEAIALINKMLRVPSLLTANRLKLYPIYDPLRNNPKFQSILKNY